MSLFLNGIPCAQMRWTATWNGVWIAEVDLMPTSSTDTVPSGRVVITTDNGIALTGTVNPAFSAAFADRRHVRVLGGGGGWGNDVRAQHYHNEVTLQLLQVLTTTAAEVGETIALLEPRALGQDFIRHNGPASQVFSDLDLDWWVGADGVTRVGTRLNVAAPADLKILDWNAAEGTMHFTCDALVEPGTLVIDERFGTRIVRKVEALVSDAAVTGTLYVSESAPKKGSSGDITDAIGKIARDEVRPERAKFYEYFVDALHGDDQVELVPAGTTVPTIIPSNVWAGISGYRAKLRPGGRVLVGFRDGEIPFVAFYAPPNEGEWRPLEIEIDALEKVTVGGRAVKVVVGDEETALPIARAPAMQTFAEAIGKAVSVASAAVTTAGGPIAPLAAILETMGKSIDAAASTMSKSLPSTKASTS